MPKRDEPTVAGCHGCGRVEVVNEDGHCARCATIRTTDPEVTIQGRRLLLSEAVRQAAEGDRDMASALEGDTVREQVRAARERRP